MVVAAAVAALNDLKIQLISLKESSAATATTITKFFKYFEAMLVPHFYLERTKSLFILD